MSNEVEKKKWYSNIDIRGMAYSIYTGTIKPMLSAYVKDTESKWDDKAFDAVNYLIEKFLKPDAK